jgi:hypothetical protein
MAPVAKIRFRLRSCAKATRADRRKKRFWDFDTEAETLSLPPQRLKRLYTLLDAFPPTRRRASISEWHQLLG